MIAEIAFVVIFVSLIGLLILYFTKPSSESQATYSPLGQPSPKSEPLRSARWAIDRDSTASSSNLSLPIIDKKVDLLHARVQRLEDSLRRQGALRH